MADQRLLDIVFKGQFTPPLYLSQFFNSQLVLSQFRFLYSQCLELLPLWICVMTSTPKFLSFSSISEGARSLLLSSQFFFSEWIGFSSLTLHQLLKSSKGWLRMRWSPRMLREIPCSAGVGAILLPRWGLSWLRKFCTHCWRFTFALRKISGLANIYSTTSVQVWFCSTL